MTERELYDAILIECNKVEAPTLLLEDYVYFANKGVQQYINQVYNRFDTDQQSSDDLRTLQNSVALEISKDEINKFPVPIENKIFRVTLPDNYMHLLNCIVHFKKVGTKKNRCGKDVADEYSSLCRRLTADQYPDIIKNHYFKPSYKNPYFYINNINTHTPNKMEIRCGDAKLYEPDIVYVDYIRKPKQINLTWDDIQNTIDTTEELEFPDYVCYEIINEIVKLILENSSDPRLSTNYAMNITVGSVNPDSSGK